MNPVVKPASSSLQLLKAKTDGCESMGHKILQKCRKLVNVMRKKIIFIEQIYFLLFVFTQYRHFSEKLIHKFTVSCCLLEMFQSYSNQSNLSNVTPYKKSKCLKMAPNIKIQNNCDLDDLWAERCKQKLHVLLWPTAGWSFLNYRLNFAHSRVRHYKGEGRSFVL